MPALSKADRAPATAHGQAAWWTAAPPAPRQQREPALRQSQAPRAGVPQLSAQPPWLALAPAPAPAAAPAAQGRKRAREQPPEPARQSSSTAVDASEEAKARRQRRFAADRVLPPPPVPERRFAHPGGKVVTNEPAATCLFLARKVASGEQLTKEQQRAIATLPRERRSVVEAVAADLCSA
eukprot:TRINITY_DN11915_c1_g1_i2.p1 TRINITY_DN11915_c1_g1~~TRINITY_DN11915_c1_g1_i2.p1  ORF type:complete len:206 (+),score=61.70 TRINITY_DN11915_c1_g1_i2:78-620(+)